MNLCKPLASRLQKKVMVELRTGSPIGAGKFFPRTNKAVQSLLMKKKIERQKNEENGWVIFLDE